MVGEEDCQNSVYQAANQMNHTRYVWKIHSPSKNQSYFPGSEL